MDELKPLFREAYFFRAFMYKEMGKEEQAAQDLNKAAQLKATLNLGPFSEPWHVRKRTFVEDIVAPGTAPSLSRRIQESEGRGS